MLITISYAVFTNVAYNFTIADNKVVCYNTDMTYRKTPERAAELHRRFVENNKDKWGEYTLLGEYKNNRTKVLMRHEPCGTEWEVNPRNFANGHGCPLCGYKTVANKLKAVKGNKFLDYLKAHPEYEMKGEYVNIRVPVEVYHKVCGQTSYYIPGVFYTSVLKHGCTLCHHCNAERERARKTFSLADANKRLEEINPEYQFVEYYGAVRQAVIKHNVCGRTFEGKAVYFILGDGHCPFCTTNISKEEREVYNWVKTLCPDAEQSVRSVDGVSELDIYVPSKKVAIEMNGHFWHSLAMLTAPDKSGNPRRTVAEGKRYHYEKSAACTKQGIRLIHIWDYEWHDEQKQKVLKNIILGALGMLPERYYARDCEVCRYDQRSPRWRELGKFFDENNIQGNRGGSLVYTLEKDGRVLMAYKFGRPSGGKAKQKYQYEMARGAAAPGVQVVGGATRLWSHFVKSEHPKSVVYYVDYNYFDGRSVEKLGGRFVASQPGVKNYWVETKEVKNREPGHHAEIKRKIENGEILELWNAGTLTYEFIYETGRML